MPEAVARASGVINKGGIVAYPTETFYGLGVKFDDSETLGKLYGIKHRSQDKALPLIIGDKRFLEIIALFVTNSAEKLIEKFWPGPLTILLSAKPHISEFITAKTGKIAVRVPGESFALHLARSLGFPITATSANISGMPPADNAGDVSRYFGDVVDLIVDCGKTPGGKPSTIVDASEEKIRILREGAVPKEEIFACF
ncbi:MAG: L-threonylcarbamoyladenylate synthase [Nitrospirota bacterium]|nr:L-threonylcarbamoyladenylate synthase [Nitrospirota bacterium]